MSEPGDDDLVTRPVTQRIVSAADASPLHTHAASSVFTSWMKPGTVPPTATEEPHERHDTPPAASTPASQTTTTKEQEEPMAQRNGAARSRKSAGGSPQLQICTALLQNDLERDAIPAAVPGLSAAQISSALHTAKSHKRVKVKDGAYTLTPAGRAWVEAAGGGEPAAPAKPERAAGTKRSAAHRRHRRARRPEPSAGEVDTSPTDAAATFRCAVMSDGCFFITKDGTTIELEPEEHKQMLHYLERMAEAEAA